MFHTLTTVILLFLTLYREGRQCKKQREKIAIYEPGADVGNGSFPHNPKKELNLPILWSCTASLQNCETTNFSCLSHLVRGTLL